MENDFCIEKKIIEILWCDFGYKCYESVLNARKSVLGICKRFQYQSFQYQMRNKKGNNYLSKDGFTGRF